MGIALIFIPTCYLFPNLLFLSFSSSSPQRILLFPGTDKAKYWLDLLNLFYLFLGSCILFIVFLAFLPGEIFIHSTGYAIQISVDMLFSHIIQYIVIVLFILYPFIYSILYYCEKNFVFQKIRIKPQSYEQRSEEIKVNDSNIEANIVSSKTEKSVVIYQINNDPKKTIKTTASLDHRKNYKIRLTFENGSNKFDLCDIAKLYNNLKDDRSIKSNAIITFSMNQGKSFEIPFKELKNTIEEKGHLKASFKLHVYLYWIIQKVQEDKFIYIGIPKDTFFDQNETKEIPQNSKNHPEFYLNEKWIFLKISMYDNNNTCPSEKETYRTIL